MARMFIKHLSGSKAGSTDQFALNGDAALSFGCSSSCDVRYSRDSDRFVSGVHARIEAVGGPPRRFRILDLDSTNGTFVNSEPVRSRRDLRRGDVIRLGRGGPEFVFDVQSPPVGQVSAISPMHSTVVSGMKTFVQGFVEYEEKRSAAALFFRVLRSPVNETLRVAMHGDEANPFTFMAIGYAVFALTGLETSLFDLSEVLPELKERGRWLNEIVDTTVLLFVSMLSMFMQYRFLRKVSPERRRFREFLVVSSVLNGMFYGLLGIAQGLGFFLDDPAVALIAGSLSIYWGIQALRIAKGFWRLPYPRLLWYSIVSTLAAAVVTFVALFVFMVVALSLRALGQPPSV